mgnify:CR=1 FL=1
MPIIIPMEDVELYNPESGTWQSTNKMSEARRYHTAILTPEDKVVVIGSIQVETFSPNTQTWSSLGDLTRNYGESYTATFLANNKILITGGRIETENGYRGLDKTEIFAIN